MNPKVFNRFLLSILVVSGLITNGAAQKTNDQPVVLPLTPAERAKLVMQDNEFERSQRGRESVIYCNPLPLNGRSLDYGQFSIHSRGELTVAVSDPDTSEARNISFQVYLRRNGKMIAHLASGFTGEAKRAVDLAQVLARSQPGDQLIINILLDDFVANENELELINRYDEFIATVDSTQSRVDNVPSDSLNLKEDKLKTDSLQTE